MTGISHKQAKRYLRADLDGLLRDKQRRDLHAHLLDCEACRVESESFSTLTERLQTDFHTRWDTQDGPSENMLNNIQSQKRRIIMSNRINVGLRTLAGIAALVVLGFVINFVISHLRNTSIAVNGTQAVGSAPSTNNRLIAFTSENDGNPEIYTLYVDGSGIRNITNNPAYDSNPVWSPDGSKITFESDRNGNRDIFVINADGSGLTQLTHDSANDVLGAFPQPQSFGYKTADVWSPDGSHILFANDRSGKWLQYVMNSDGSNVKELTQASASTPGEMFWSPSGKQLAGISISDAGWSEITVVNVDGTNPHKVKTTDPLVDHNDWMVGRIIGWSRDEKSLYYEYSTGDGYWYILKTTTSSTGIAQKISDGYALSGGLLIDGWLGSDSVLSYVTNQTGGKYGSSLHNTQNGKIIYWNNLVSCGYILPNSSQQPNSNEGYPYEDLGVSKSGSQAVLGVSCPNKGYSELYSLNSNTATIDKIARFPTIWDGINISWSADDQTILIQGTSKSGKTDLYVLNAEDLQKKPLKLPALIWSNERSMALLQPVPFNSLTAQNPSTAVPALQTTPSSTPLWTGTSNGDLIAFDSDANGNSDIYLAKSNGSGVTNLTNRSSDDFAPTWSPDGNWVAFVSGFNGNYSLHVMRPDGSGEKKLADTWWGVVWSPDSNKIAYLVNLPDNPSDYYSPAKISLKIIDLDGNILQDTYLGIYNQAGQLRWSTDGRSLLYIATQIATDNNNGATTVTESDIYQIKLDGKQPVLLVKSDQQIDEWSGISDNLTYLDRDTLTWNLIHTNGQNQTKLATWDPVADQCGSSIYNDWDSISASDTKHWSPDGTRLLIGIVCPNDERTWFYLGNTNGEFIQLLNYSVGSNSVGYSLSWSSNGQYIIFSSDLDAARNWDLYILDVKAALKDPSTRPVRITTSGFAESSPVWQP